MSSLLSWAPAAFYLQRLFRLGTSLETQQQFHTFSTASWRTSARLCQPGSWQRRAAGGCTRTSGCAAGPSTPTCRDPADIPADNPATLAPTYRQGARQAWRLHPGRQPGRHRGFIPAARGRQGGTIMAGRPASLLTWRPPAALPAWRPLAGWYTGQQGGLLPADYLVGFAVWRRQRARVTWWLVAD